MPGIAAAGCTPDSEFDSANFFWDILMTATDHLRLDSHSFVDPGKLSAPSLQSPI
jgi:hypothetical protein